MKCETAKPGKCQGSIIQCSKCSKGACEGHSFKCAVDSCDKEECVMCFNECSNCYKTLCKKHQVNCHKCIDSVFCERCNDVHWVEKHPE